MEVSTETILSGGALVAAGGTFFYLNGKIKELTEDMDKLRIEMKGIRTDVQQLKEMASNIGNALELLNKRIVRVETPGGSKNPGGSKKPRKKTKSSKPKAKAVISDDSESDFDLDAM